jgi:hypothetical protein
MTITLTKRHVVVAALLALAVLVGGVLARQALTGLVVSALLQVTGASEVNFTITAASPWRVVVEDIGFQMRSQAFAAKRITLTRPHWWSPSLGSLRVEQARVPLALDDLKAKPSSATASPLVPVPGTPVQVPFEEIAVEGELVFKAPAQPEQVLAVKIAAKQTAQKSWTGHATVEAPGLSVLADATFDPAKSELDFKVSAFSVDVKTWQGFVEGLLPVPSGGWEVAGKLSGAAAGRYAGGKLAAGGTLRLREGRAQNAADAVLAEGIEADLEFTDFESFLTKPGTMRVRELQTGKLVLRELDYEFAFANSNQVTITRATLKALGGTVAAEPFDYFIDREELDAVVLVDGISIEEVMALTKDLPAKATGRVNGRFPVQINEAGFRLGSGWLELKPGVPAEVEFNASGLLTGGMSTSSPGYAVLKKVESGLLKLGVTELRLDIRPPNAPAGRSATLHIAGAPTDPGVKAPVTLDLNVNGPLEKLLNMGMDSRLNFGTGK